MARTELDDGPDDDGPEDDSITAGGTWPTGGRSSVDPALLEAQLWAQSGSGSEPNGWFAGPHSEPDRFELLGPGLAGGEGNTWRARYKGELANPLTLAVKELRRPVHAPPQWPTPADVRRWDDQRALLQYMRIDHLVTVIDIFVGSPPHLPGQPENDRRPPDTPYVAMEWVPGPTLADQFSGEPATASNLDERLAHVQHVAEALHSLHSRTASAGNPTLHRDVKPTNCILDPRRGVVLVDVGTMRRMDDGYDHDGLHTPAYTAPEVLANPRAPRAAASDLYSLGALAYFCVLGEDPPTAAQTGSADRIEARLLAAARSAEVADPRGFADHLRLMLQASPEQRPADAMSWSRRLRALAAVRGRRRPIEVRAGVGTLVVLVAAVVVLSTLRWFGVGPLAPDSGSKTPAAGSTSGAELRSRQLTRQPGPPPGPPPSGFAGGPPPGGVPPSGATDGAAAGPEPPIRTELAAFTAPRNGDAVPQCLVITGTSKLPAGHTLLFSVENLSAGDRVRHLGAIDGWQQPSTLSRWRVAQFVGMSQDPVSTRYRLEVFDVPLTALQQQIADGGSERGRWGTRIPAGASIAASVFVTRSTQPNAC